MHAVSKLAIAVVLVALAVVAGGMGYVGAAKPGIWWLTAICGPVGFACLVSGIRDLTTFSRRTNLHESRVSPASPADARGVAKRATILGIAYTIAGYLGFVRRGLEGPNATFWFGIGVLGFSATALFVSLHKTSTRVAHTLVRTFLIIVLAALIAVTILSVGYFIVLLPQIEAN
jgi:hypothetical protein